MMRRKFYWYYYGKDGKATVSKFKTIEDNWYYFDDDGRMMTGLPRSTVLLITLVIPPMDHEKRLGSVRYQQ